MGTEICILNNRPYTNAVMAQEGMAGEDVCPMEYRTLTITRHAGPSTLDSRACLQLTINGEYINLTDLQIRLLRDQLTLNFDID